MLRENTTTVQRKAFIRRVIEHFKPYYTGVDKAHGLSHVVKVMFLALKINKALNISRREDLIIIAAIAHDMFSYTHRETHHLEASRYISTTEDILISRLPTTDIIMISQAVAQHRASYDGPYYGWLSELISAADRGVPNLSSITRRVYSCAKDTSLIFKTDNMVLTTESHEELYLERTLLHLKAKYGKNGYARYNNIYKRMFKNDLEKMQDYIVKLSIDDINVICSSSNKG